MQFNLFHLPVLTFIFFIKLKRSAKLFVFCIRSIYDIFNHLVLCIILLHLCITLIREKGGWGGSLLDNQNYLFCCLCKLRYHLYNRIRHFILKNLQKLHLKKLIYRTYLCLKTLFVTDFTPKTNGHLIQTS